MGLFGNFQTLLIMSPSRTRTPRARGSRPKKKGARGKSPAKAKTPAAKSAAAARKKDGPAPKARTMETTGRVGLPAQEAEPANRNAVLAQEGRKPAIQAERPRAASESDIRAFALNDLPAEGANGRFRIQFVYRGMQFVVRVLAKEARGAHLFMEGHLGFVPFSYEGPDMRGQLLAVLQLARRQKAVEISLVGEQRIALTANLRVEGALTPNSIISAAATRLAAVKPLLDVIRTLQPYHHNAQQAATARIAV